MPYRLTKIYTRTGDDGNTSLGEKRIPKDDTLIEALGTLDELNSVIGLMLSFGANSQVKNHFQQIQNELFNIGAELISTKQAPVSAEKVTQLEQWLDQWNADLPPLKEFLLPGGTPAAAAGHVARTVCRRAERCLVRLNRVQTLQNPEILRYVNRLSDLLFVTARMLAREVNQQETTWQR